MTSEVVRVMLSVCLVSFVTQCVEHLWRQFLKRAASLNIPFPSLCLLLNLKPITTTHASNLQLGKNCSSFHLSFYVQLALLCANASPVFLLFVFALMRLHADSKLSFLSFLTSFGPRFSQQAVHLVHFLLNSFSKACYFYFFLASYQCLRMSLKR